MWIYSKLKKIRNYYNVNNTQPLSYDRCLVNISCPTANELILFIIFPFMIKNWKTCV